MQTQKNSPKQKVVIKIARTYHRHLILGKPQSSTFELNTDFNSCKPKIKKTIDFQFNLNSTQILILANPKIKQLTFNFTSSGNPDPALT